MWQDEIYSTVRRHFGSEWPPGADDNVPISILHYEDPDDNMSGFFPPDTEMLHVNLVHKKPGKEPYFATLAHELQHMIHWNNDRNEERWLDEGFSELAERLAGFDPGWDDESFREEFDTQLNYWPDEEHGAIPPPPTTARAIASPSTSGSDSVMASSGT
jgi:immune inhibitor A